MTKRSILTSVMLVFSFGLWAQERDKECEQARELMNDGKYLKASQLLKNHYSGTMGDEHKLDILFYINECSYLLDDYRSMFKNINEYVMILNKATQIEENKQQEYLALYHKMVGSYYYGQTSKNYDSFFELSENSFKKCLAFFTQNYNVFRQNDIHKELAQLYYRVRDYEQAASHLISIKNYFESIDLGNSEYYDNLSNLAMCNARLGATTYSSILADSLFKESLQHINAVISYFSTEETVGIKYYEALRRKGKILHLQDDKLGTDNKKEAIECYKKFIQHQYQTLTPELLNMDDSMREQRWLNLHQFLYDCCRVSDVAPDMIYDLILFTKGYLLELANQFTAPNIHWKQVQQSLGNNDCAIEFVEYFGKNDEKRLGSLILRKDFEKPVFIDISSVNYILNLPTAEYWTTVNDAMSYTSALDINHLYNSSNLAKNIWTEKLLKAIGNATNIYFSPDGLLHQLAIEYIFPDTTKTCYRLSSTRVLCKKKHASKLDNALIIGGVDFSANVSSSNTGNDSIAYQILSSTHPKILYLPGTERETNDIYNLRENKKDVILTGKDATDENFEKQLEKHFSIIHISTHGVYSGQLSTVTDLKPLIIDNSMSDNVLIFAGAEKNLNNIFFDSSYNDGIISATELYKLRNLRDVDLVVLSACKTGLGHLTSDGVYGIQRALKLAGVKAMVVSLWEVNDEATSIMMKNFYKALKEQKSPDIHAAFKIARNNLINETFKSKTFESKVLGNRMNYRKFSAPSYSNPFILIDAL